MGLSYNIRKTPEVRNLYITGGTDMSTATMIRHFVHDVEVSVVISVDTPTEHFALFQLYALNEDGSNGQLLSSVRYSSDPAAVRAFDEFVHPERFI
jgi:hypothetical protein